MTAGTSTTADDWPDIPTDAEGRLVRIAAVSVISHGVLRVRWTDHVERDVDLSDLFDKPHPLCSAIADPALFATVRVGEFGGLEWENGMDSCPHATRLRADEQYAARMAAAE